MDLLHGLTLALGFVRKSDTIEDTGQVQRCANGIGQLLERVFALLPPVVKAGGSKLMKSPSCGKEGMAESVVIENAVQVGSEDPSIRGDASVELVPIQDCEWLSAIGIHGFANMNLVTVDVHRGHSLTE